MSVVDRILQSLIRYLQKKQKIRTKKKKKRGPPPLRQPHQLVGTGKSSQAVFSKVSRKAIKSKSVKKKVTGVKRETVYSKVRAVNRPVKGAAGKTSVPRRKVEKKILGKNALLIKKPAGRLKIKGNNGSYVGGGASKPIKGPRPSADALIGEVTHFFPRIQVIVLKMTKGSLRVNQKVRVWGRGTDFIQKVVSLQIESVDVKTAHRGQLVGLKVDKPVHVGSKVYLMG